MLLAFGINRQLMAAAELSRLPLMYLPVGAVLLWILGQVAVFGPARRAASVPPAVATRAAWTPGGHGGPTEFQRGRGARTPPRSVPFAFPFTFHSSPRSFPAPAAASMRDPSIGATISP